LTRERANCFGIHHEEEKMETPKTILTWLKEAGVYAYRREDPDLPGGRILVDVIIGNGMVVCTAR